MDNHLNGTIDRIEENKVVIALQSGEHLIWPIEKMPFLAKEGLAVKVAISAQDGQAESEKVAKDLLNEILQTP